MTSELRDVIQGDVAAHRHRLLPGVEIRCSQIAVIVSAVAVLAATIAIVVDRARAAPRNGIVPAT